MNLTQESIAESLDTAGMKRWILPERLSDLVLFLQRLMKINEVINLTRMTSDEDIKIQHILDSAASLPLLERLSGGVTAFKALDLGTGAGFPGLMVAFAFPEWEVTFLDATAKKIQALSNCLEGLKVTGTAIHGRAEDLGRDPNFRETWDIVTARAVADLPVLLEYALPLLKPGGYLVDWITEDQKSKVNKSENALKWLCGKIHEIEPYSLPGLNQTRYLLVVEKLGKTPMRYPRLSGYPAKHPL